MTFPFQKLQLEADSLYALIDTWIETQLEVTADTVAIIGYGFTHDIAEAFSALVLDWEATILLDQSTVDLAEGNYDLIRIEDTLYACREQKKFAVPDQGVRVEVFGGVR